jgi:hypothetical protein
MLGPEAMWCGQCHLDFRRRRRVPTPPAPPRPDVVAAARAEGNEAFSVWVGQPAVKEADLPSAGAWPCPACGFQNAMSLDACGICATPFAKLFEEKKHHQAPVIPSQAAVASLFFPGLGHIRCGRLGEGIARAVLFVWALGTAVLLTATHPPSGAGPLRAVAGLFFTAAAAVYVFSAVDSARVADGQPPVLSPKVLLYGSAGLVVMSVVSLFMLVFKVTGKLPPH